MGTTPIFYSLTYLKKREKLKDEKKRSIKINKHRSKQLN